MTVKIDEGRVVESLQVQGYATVAERFGLSRGAVYRIAVRHGARKNEVRIRERTVERLGRRREFLQEVLDATETSDVLDFLEGLPDESVQLHLTSPPYNTGKKYGDVESMDGHRFHYYLGWTLQVLSEMSRSLAQGGVMFLQIGNTRTDAGQRYPLDCLLFEHLRGMGLTFQDRVVWELPHGLTPKGRLAERYETALVFSKGDSSVFNATPGRTPQKNPGKRAFKGKNVGKLSGNPLGAHPSNVWRITHLKHGHPEKSDHPAQFPEELAKRAIQMYTMPGDLVCDVFMGSGTTAAASKRTSRHFTGCDLFYGDARRERLRKVDPDLASMLPGVSKESVEVWQAEARKVQS